MEKCFESYEKIYSGLKVCRLHTFQWSCDVPSWLRNQQVRINHAIHDLPVKVSITVGCRKLSALSSGDLG